MRFKVGDEVKVKKDLNKYKMYNVSEYTKLTCTHEMEEYYKGSKATIVDVNSSNNIYKLDIDGAKFDWTDEMLEPMEEVEDTNISPNTVTIDLNKLNDDGKKTVQDLIKKLENPFDTPKHKHTYYYISTIGKVVTELWQNTDVDNARYFLGNYFLIKEDAEFEVEKRKVIRKLEILSQKAGALDWGKLDEPKYSIRYSHYDSGLRIFEAYGVRCIDRIYFTTKESLQDAIELIGEDNIKKYIFGVED